MRQNLKCAMNSTTANWRLRSFLEYATGESKRKQAYGPAARSNGHSNDIASLPFLARQVSVKSYLRRYATGRTLTLRLVAPLVASNTVGHLFRFDLVVESGTEFRLRHAGRLNGLPALHLNFPKNFIH